jgi:hypothetical protein
MTGSSRDPRRKSVATQRVPFANYGPDKCRGNHTHTTEVSGNRRVRVLPFA